MPRPDAEPDAVYFARELRGDMTPHEHAAWDELRKRRLGVRFRRQVPIGPYIADFACLAKKLVVEIDGSVHDFQDDTRRTAFLEGRGFTVLRFSNDEVEEIGVGHTIKAWLEGEDADSS